MESNKCIAAEASKEWNGGEDKTHGTLQGGWAMRLEEGRLMRVGGMQEFCVVTSLTPLAFYHPTP